MAPIVCEKCGQNRAVMVRPKDAQRLCKTCFIQIFEDEVHETIIHHKLFFRGERIAIGASGGKDSTVLAAVLKTLNERHDYGLDLVLLSIDEGITGYRDDSLETVKRNAKQYEMPLTIVGYSELYGWTMDEVVKQIGKKGNCTYCGVFRRQALDRGAAMLGIRHVVTGHNADDVAETVIMNLLRGDLPRLSRATSILTGSAVSDVKRSKPLKYAYEKEIVLYAHHRSLDYFTTECIYSPEAFRGSARSLIKDLERIRPSALLDVVRSGEDMARLVPVAQDGAQAETEHGSIPVEDEDDGSNGCGSKNAALPTPKEVGEHSMGLRLATAKSLHANQIDAASITSKASSKQGLTQKMGRCIHCGYLSSQAVCKACVLIAALNTNRPKSTIIAERPNDLTTQMHAKLEHLTI